MKDYNYDIKYHPNKANVVVDTLSKCVSIIVNGSKRNLFKPRLRVDWVSDWGSIQIRDQIHISGRDQGS